MAGPFTLKITNFKKICDVLDPVKFKQRMRKEVGKATILNGLVAEGEIKRSISEGKYQPNARATIFLKGSSKPLVDTGELYKNITSEARAWDTAEIGVLRNRTYRSKSGNPKELVNVAKVVHNGIRIKVTPRMRAYLATQGILLSPRTTFIRIPPRPFLQAALTKPLVAKYQENWQNAIARALGKQRSRRNAK